MFCLRHQGQLLYILVGDCKEIGLSVFPDYWQFLPEGLLSIKGLLRMKE
jgi:hypothetical protein